MHIDRLQQVELKYMYASSFSGVIYNPLTSWTIKDSISGLNKMDNLVYFWPVDIFRRVFINFRFANPENGFLALRREEK